VSNEIICMICLAVLNTGSAKQSDRCCKLQKIIQFEIQTRRWFSWFCHESEWVCRV